MKNLQYCWAISWMALAFSSISPPSVSFILSWTTSAPPSKQRRAASTSETSPSIFLSVMAYSSNKSLPPEESVCVFAFEVVDGIEEFGPEGTGSEDLAVGYGDLRCDVDSGDPGCHGIH